MASSIKGNAPIKINQDANIFALELEQGNEISFPIKEGRQGYLVQIEGTLNISGIKLTDRDGLEILEEEGTIKTIETSHLLLIEMKKED